jgi:biopolymer transport protein ExbD
MNGNSRRSRRLVQRQAKARHWPALNLVPLMDVFTILVFFFLVHSTDVALTADRSVISLPESVAERKPRQTLVVTITREAILVQGEAVVSVAAASGAAGEEIGVLRTALARQLERTRIVPVEADADAAVHEVMIMGDKSIPFALLRKVMLTCTRAGYEHISLSVIQRAPRPG